MITAHLSQNTFCFGLKADKRVGSVGECQPSFCRSENFECTNNSSAALCAASDSDVEKEPWHKSMLILSTSPGINLAKIGCA
jgi:hypothetical protein